ncbi:MAG: oligosaccharide repeat unit polymerase [bacterium]|nr:oligosaccharide repeat unit polymerase [bacterium]
MSPGDVLWILAFAAVSLVGLAASRRFFGHWFTPLSIYTGMNCGSLALYHLRVLDLIRLSELTYGLAFGSIALFAAGTLSAAGWRPIRIDPAASRRRDASHLDAFYYITASIATVGWMLALAIMVSRYGLGGLLSNVWRLQGEFQMQFIGNLNLIGILVAPTYLIKRFYGVRRRIDDLVLLSCLLGLLLAGIKSYITISAIAALMVWGACRPDRFRATHMMLALAALLAFFVVYTQTIDIYTPESYDTEGSEGRVAPLQRPYLYIVGSWPALTAVIAGEAEPPPRFGHVLLQPVWKVLAGLGAVKPHPSLLPFVSIGITEFNVYAFAGEVYWDAGLWTALLMSWLLGFLATRAYLVARVAAYWGHALIYALVGYGVFMSLFAYFYTFNFVLLLSYTWFLGFFVLRGGIFVDRRRLG